MALLVPVSSSGTGVRVDLTTVDSVFVGEGVQIVSTDSTAIEGAGSSHSVTILGNVYGSVTAISLGDDDQVDTGNRVFIAEGAAVSTSLTTLSVAVLIEGSAGSVTNLGNISGLIGIVIGGSSDSPSSVVNDGVISASLGISHLTSDVNDVLVIRNSGAIIVNAPVSDAAAIGRFFTDSGAIEEVYNTGTIVGDIFLGGGNDLYDGRGGTVAGDILGDAGNDLFRPGAGAEVISGGAGTDTLDFRAGGAVRVALDGSFGNTGLALGDTFSGIENIFGSAGANDALTGSAAANTLRGNGGADRLIGGAGADRLAGGLQVDRLTGGTGNDTFIFESLPQGGDIITDFSRVAGNNDLFNITAAAFGGGLVAGALAAGQFRTRADNLAQDADDRFIFRTTDQTLWFDANGNAAGGLTLVADLQAGAVVTAVDIVLV